MIGDVACSWQVRLLPSQFAFGLVHITSMRRNGTEQQLRARRLRGRLSSRKVGHRPSRTLIEVYME